MKGKSILFLILAYTAISRFFLVDKILPLLNKEVLYGRMLSGGINIVSAVIIFFLVKEYFKKTKIALLTAWVYSILPWTFEQSRIISQPNLTLALVLAVLILVQNINSKGKKILLFLIPIIFFFFYQQLWLFRLHEFTFNLYSFVFNFFTLLTFDFLFFKNTSFWWGGVKEFGIMLLSFLPFFVIGIYKLIISKEKKLLILFIFTAVIAALSPFFPESREFYLSTPILSLAVAMGIYYFSLHAKFAIRLLFVSLFFIMIYELSQYYHFYFIHYPQEVRGNFSQIHESF